MMAETTPSYVQNAAPAGTCLKCGAQTAEDSAGDRDFCPECRATAPLPLSHYYMAHYYGNFAD